MSREIASHTNPTHQQGRGIGPLLALRAGVLVWLLTTVLFGAKARGNEDTFTSIVKPFLKAHCVKCHSAKQPAGEMRLDDLSAEMSRDVERWLAVRDQLRDGLMPPEKEPQPAADRTRTVIAWIGSRAGSLVGHLPNEGNRIAHELLFGTSATDDAAATPGRVWRLSPEGYVGFVRDVHRGQNTRIVQPFTVIPERGLKDYAALYSIDEASTEILLRNAAAIVEAQSAHEFREGQLRGKNGTVRQFVELMAPDKKPTREELRLAVRTQFRLAISRLPSDEETERFLSLYDRCVNIADSPSAVKVMLQAVLLRTDAMYRSEIGGKVSDAAGRRMLDPDEIARAVSLALGDRRESGIVQAAAMGELTTREQVAAHVRRILETPEIEKPRLLRFFREYFEYGRALDVFKDRPKDFMYEPRQYVADTDFLVLHILDQDRDVFRQLLTTPLSFVNLKLEENKQTRRKDVQARAVTKNPQNNKGQAVIEAMYGFDDWPSPQPVRLAENTRIGILMQPSWLIAFSTNFDNDPVRRGRWIRERLLGGTVPDLPIGVVAQVPDNPDRTLRERLTVTREAQCWKCHQRMDDLGLPFENFDHYGRFRTTESVRDLEATAKNVDKKGNPLGPVFRDVELLTQGIIADSGDAKLDGPVSDPRELIHRIADSDRARQVFIRHVFRYFLGRNESLADARTLQEADRAYVMSDGSFRELVVSLLTSDAFLLRSTVSEELQSENVTR